MSEESKEMQERAPSARSPEEDLQQAATDLMCNVLGKQQDPDWIPNLTDWHFVVATLSAAEQRGCERGIEEAARIVMAMRGEEAAVWADFADATLEVAAGRIRALSGNASDSSPSSLSDPSPLVVQENKQGACGAEAEETT